MSRDGIGERGHVPDRLRWDRLSRKRAGHCARYQYNDPSLYDIVERWRAMNV